MASVFDSAWLRMAPGDGVVGDYWYEPEYQMLVAMDDRVFQNTTVLLYDKQPGTGRVDNVLVGVMSTYRRARVSEDVIWRAGPMAVVNFQGGDRSVLLLCQPQYVSRTFPIYKPFVAVQGTAKF